MIPIRRLISLSRLLILTLLASACAACGAAPASSSGATGACSLEIKVRGDVQFEAKDFSYNTNLGEKNGQPFFALMGNQVARRDHPFILWLGFPRSAEASTVPFYTPGLGLISLNLIGKSEYTPFETSKAGKDPGSLTITSLDDAWVEAHGQALLFDSEGGNVEVEINLSTALPPARCP